MLTKADIEAQLRTLAENQRDQEAGLLKMRGAQIALQQLLALIDSRENPPDEVAAE